MENTRSQSLFAVPRVIVGCIALFLVYTAAKLYVQYRKLAHIKGPWIAGFSPAWVFYHTAKGDLAFACEDVLKQYGSPARIAPDQIVTDDPAFMRMMNAPRSPFYRGRWFDGMRLGADQDNVLTTVDEKVHAELRAKLMPGYTGKEVPTLEADVDSHVLELVKLIREKYVAKGIVLDFARVAGFFTLDILTKIAFGLSLGFLRNDEDLYNYHKTTRDFYPLMEMGSYHPTVLRILGSRIVQWFAGPRPEDKAGMGAILGEVHAAVAQRFDESNEKSGISDDMLASFIRHGLTRKECETESMLQILAGSDSTATALRTIFLYILTNPLVYSKLTHEITAAAESGDVSFPVIKNSEAQALPYLQACIKEGLRIFMPLQGLAGRVSPGPDGVTVEDIHIPAETDVGAAVYAMMRRSDLFGPDAESYKPERWTESDAETVKSYEKIQDITFGSGRASCLGRGIALMELNKAIFELFRNFDFCIVNPFTAMKIRSNSVVVQENMLVRVYPKH